MYDFDKRLLSCFLGQASSYPPSRTASTFQYFQGGEKRPVTRPGYLSERWEITRWPQPPSTRTHHKNGRQITRNSSSGMLGCRSTAGRRKSLPGTRADTQGTQGLRVEQKLRGNCGRPGQGRCSQVSGFFRSGPSSWFPRCSRPLDNNCDDQAIAFIDWRNTQNTPLLRALGSICSATIQLPHTTILSDGLEVYGEIAVASGGFTDTWRGLYQGRTAALKAFRTFPLQDLREAEKVRPTSWGTLPF